MLIVALARADEAVWDDGLAAGWEDWSWSASCASSADAWAGTAALHCELDAWGALSLHRGSGFGTARALGFAFRGDPSAVDLMLEGDDGSLESWPMEDFVLGSDWVEGQLELPTGAWTRINLMDRTGAGGAFDLDLVWLRDELVAEQAWTAAEPVAADLVELIGAGSADIVLRFEGEERGFVLEAGEGRSWLRLDRPLSTGLLEVETLDGVFSRRLEAASATVAGESEHAISPLIYGQAFTPADQVAAQGVKLVRWGGNAVSLHNPAIDATNLAADWYFENQAASPIEAWLDEVHGAGAAAFLTVPALDWVARDDHACAYSVAKYGPQQSTDPWRPDCGDGVGADGVPIDWNDPEDAATVWTLADLAAWVGGLDPELVAIGNELDIASSTHRDVHPEPVDYEELFSRWYGAAEVVRAALPDATLAGPSSCCWWYYWNDAASTKDAHGGQDLLPWWLDQVAAADAAAGVRSLDLLDIHYYPAQEGVFSEADDAATAALRLRATRSLWDPSYTDESWIGSDVWATSTQPEPNVVQLIPRFKALIDAHYPGTKLGIGEWNFGAETALSGGLAVADALGIFGREGLDLATYWTTPQAGSPAAAAFTLYAGFGDASLAVAFDDPDRLGVYAALADGARTVVVVNKSEVDLVLDLGLVGEARQTRFGGALGGELVEAPASEVDGVVVVPAWAATRFDFGSGGGGEDTDRGGEDTGGEAPAETGSAEKAPDEGCGCAGAAGRSPAALLALLLAGRRRARKNGR